MAAEEEIFQLFDSFWFEHQIFSQKPLPSPHQVVEIPQEVEESHQEVEERKEIQESKSCGSGLSSIHHVRSSSDQFLSATTSFSSDPFSPDSVLRNNTTTTPRVLQTIRSGKEEIEFLQQEKKTTEAVASDDVGVVMKPRRRIRRKKENGSKSLSDLEFEEVKGFMDLGFVFSEEDNKDSSLVSILPGLQRLNKNQNVQEQEQGVSRPYLSEAWEALEQKRLENQLRMNKLRISALKNNTGVMKDHLRSWAHTVASTVR